MTEKEREEGKLQEVISDYKEVIEDLDLTIKSLSRRQNLDPDVVYELERQYKNKLRVIKESLNKPYFARIDFQNSSDEAKDVCYIGKVGVSDFDNNLITVDWRAPIASLYYDSNLGKTSYKSPEGIIDGDLCLKRQYDIEESKLISFNDVDTVSNDEILKPYLDVNADNRLKNIVSSIQDEQNKVIRKDLTDNVIVQGVAGSGKTTVALHRIAYLAYNHRDMIKSNQYMVIGPNKFFINYISSILPDLDVTDVAQLTYDEFVKEYLGEGFEVVDGEEVVGALNINRYKVSMNYKKLLDEYIAYLEKTEVLPKKDFEVKGYNLLPQKVVEKIYREIDDLYFKNIEAKLDRAVLMCSTYLKNKEQELTSYLMKEYSEKMQIAKTEKEKTKIRKDYDSLKKELLATGCTASLKKYFSFRNKKITTLYSTFLQNISKFADKDITELIKKTISKKKNTYMIEDLAGLLYLGFRVKNNKDYNLIRHTVVDEAQDYGEFNFYSLKAVLPGSRFSIFGDLAQSIYDYRSIDNWEDVATSTFKGDCNIEYLRKSYRTTIEIMNAANVVLNHINLKTAEPVIRHGNEVIFIKATKDYYKNLLERVRVLEEKKYESIALISRNEEEAHKIKQELEKLDCHITEITADNSEYTGGLCSVSSSLAKGLEFDAVIITDASEDKYNSLDSTDMKNLYVSMTRPLHELEIVYRKELTKPLQKCLKR